MTTAILVDSVSSKALIKISRKATIVRRLTPDDGVFHVKSGSYDLGHLKEESVFFVSVGDGIVNPGFVEANSDENVLGDSGLPRTDRLSDGQPGRNEKADNSSPMVINPLEEQRRGLPFTNQRTETGETKLENISAGKNELNNT